MKTKKERVEELLNAPVADQTLRDLRDIRLAYFTMVAPTEPLKILNASLLARKTAPDNQELLVGRLIELSKDLDFFDQKQTKNLRKILPDFMRFIVAEDPTLEEKMAFRPIVNLLSSAARQKAAEEGDLLGKKLVLSHLNNHLLTR